MDKTLTIIIAATSSVLVSCTSPPVENVVIVQPAPRTNTLRTPEKVKTYTSGKYTDRADQLHEAHQVNRIVQSPRWNLSYSPRNMESVSSGPVRIAAPVSHNPDSYRSRLASLEQENKQQEKRLAEVVAQDGGNAAKEIADIRSSIKSLEQQVDSLDKVDPELEALKSKVASLEQKLSEQPAVIGNVWVPVNEKSK